MMHVLDASDVDTVLTPDLALLAVRCAFAGLAAGVVRVLPRTVCPLGPGGATAGIMVAAGEGDSGGHVVKSIVLAPGNPARGLDTHQGAVLLHEAVTGAVRAVIEAGSLTAIRTAATSGLSAQLLARRDIDVVAIVGTGTQARHHLRMFRHLYPGATLRVGGRSSDRAQCMARDEGAVASDTIEAAVRGADVVVTATASAEPVIRSGWIADGCHVVAVGATGPHRREIGSDLMRRALIHVESRDAGVGEMGEVILAQAEGALPDDAIRGDLAELISGRVPGREAMDQVTLFKSVGNAAADLLAAEVALDAAIRSGVGTAVPFA